MLTPLKLFFEFGNKFFNIYVVGNILIHLFLIKKLKFEEKP
jgi:hypothetical protein